MTEFTPKSFLTKVGSDVLCYDLEFVCGEAAHIGYEFKHKSGMSLTIDVNTEGDPIVMTLVHVVGATNYQAAGSYDEFLDAAKKAYAFAKHMVAFAEAQKKVQKRVAALAIEIRQRLAELEEDLLQEAVKSAQEAEKFGPQARIAA